MTSSLESRRVPAPSEHLDGLCQALVEVGERSYTSFVEPCDAARLDEILPGLAREPWMQASVEFRGAFGGAFRMALPESLARDLVGSFLGLPPGEPADDGQVADLTGEMANMVCGDWLTRACFRRRFDLRPPVVAPLPEGWSPGCWGLPGSPDGALMCLNDQPVCLHLSFVPQSA